jgi:hypothetical protein
MLISHETACGPVIVQCVKNAVDECVDGISQTVGEVDDI